MRTLREVRHIARVEWVTVHVRVSQSRDGEGEAPPGPDFCGLLGAYFEGRLMVMGVGSAIVGGGICRKWVRCSEST